MKLGPFTPLELKPLIELLEFNQIEHTVVMDEKLAEQTRRAQDRNLGITPLSVAGYMYIEAHEADIFLIADEFERLGIHVRPIRPT